MNVLPDIQIKCSECGSEDVTLAIDGKWSVERQSFINVKRSEWVEDYCHDCGATMSAQESFVKGSEDG